MARKSGVQRSRAKENQDGTLKSRALFSSQCLERRYNAVGRPLRDGAAGFVEVLSNGAKDDIHIS